MRLLILIVTAVLFLISSPGHEASRIHKEEQNLMSKNQLLGLLQAQVSSAVPNQTTGNNILSSKISQKAFASDHNVFSSIRPLLIAYIPPSVPIKTTSNIPSPKISQKAFASDHNVISSIRRLLVAYIPPSAPNPETSIPAPASPTATPQLGPSPSISKGRTDQGALWTARISTECVHRKK